MYNLLIPRPARRNLFSALLNRNSFSTTKTYDVVISGGGPVGAAFAAALSRLEYLSSSDSSPRILLLDKSPTPNVSEYFRESTPDHRVITLTPGSVRFLKSLKIWEHLNPRRVTSFNKMQVWEENGSNFFSLEDPGHSELGQVIEVQHLVAALYKQLETYKVCEVQIPSSIEALEHTGDKFLKLKLNNDEVIHTRLLVGSEGRGSNVKKLSGISTHGWSYNQMGIVCTIRTNLKDNKVAWQRYLQEGPLALLPMWDDYYSIVWTVGLDRHERLMKLSDEEFLREINYNISKQSKYDTVAIPCGSSGYQYPPMITHICKFNNKL
jgi:ubiquinone biosynthesis UbiH/UbiF/VisC/COQ6 family hydroxylase